MTQATIVPIVERLYAAWEAQDYSEILSQVDDSFEWIVPGDNRLTGKAVGPAAVAEVFDALSGIGYRVSPRHFISDDERVVTLAQVTIGETKIGAIDIWTFADDHLVKYQHASTDTTLLDRALGAPSHR